MGLAGFQVLSLALSGLKVNGEGGWAQWEFGGGRSWRIREIDLPKPISFFPYLGNEEQSLEVYKDAKMRIKWGGGG